MNRGERGRFITGSLVLGLIALLAAGSLGVDHALGQVVFVATYAIAGLGVILVVGQSGQISLGQGALLAIGAYAQTLLVLRGVPAIVAMPMAVALAAAGGWLASLPARRLGGLYFAMSTLAFALIVEELLARWESITHGAAGVSVPAFSVGGWSAGSTLAQAVVSVLALALSWWCCHRWVESCVGRAWRAVREDEVAAASSGIDVARAKSRAFVIGGGLSGLSGALYAHWIGFVSPEQFGLLLSFELLMLAFIGGARRLSGALWGALVIVAIPQAISLWRNVLPAELARSAGLEALLFGAVIVAVILFRPQGITGRSG
jgi:branched-chain amino acid transport system permease protein